ncbi:MAG: RHS repeat-associated core domain-containing protein, partial [Verrucomicrobia bacterium]|nr:RHS repeat-associated core domain-containing protein [Verrucomicrobiota bacterium]
ERSHFGNGVRVMRYLGPKESTSAQTSYEFAAKDHLGSDTATFDGQGQLRQQRGHLKPGEVQKTERQSYDAWGARRDGDTWAPASGQLNKLSATEATMTSPSQSGGQPSGSPPERVGSNLPRGYTGHEMLDDVGLVHMNGRLYDSALGRMCAADPYVQSSEAIQNYNRYSYVMNNPMNATDPSGLSWLSKWWKVIVAVIIAIIIAIVAAYLMGALLNVLGFGGGAAAGTAGGGTIAAGATAAAGGATSAVSTAIFAVGVGVQAGMTAYSMTKGGASFGQILKAVAIGAAVAGVTAAISQGVLHGLGDHVKSYGSSVANAAAEKAATETGAAITGQMVAERVVGTIVHGAAHGVVGGAAAAAQGGSFKSGFISAVVSFGVDVIGMQTLGSSLYDMSNRSVMAVAGRTAVAAISGGMASVATGGKFTQAAFTAGFMHLFNQEGVGAISAWRDNVLSAATALMGSEQYPNTSFSLEAEYGRSGYTVWETDKNKCNCYVYYSLIDADLKPLMMRDGKWAPPQAGDYANSNAKIYAFAKGSGKGQLVGEWVVTRTPMRGDIVAIKIDGGGSRFSGHVGILYDFWSDGSPMVAAAHGRGSYVTPSDGINQAEINKRVYRSFVKK